jgi:hypothetical protein
LNAAPRDLVHELLTQSLSAWGIGGRIERASDGSLRVGGSRKDIRIERSSHEMFRWTVTIDGRQRQATSIVAVLRQVREALDPGYTMNRVRIAAAPLVPPQ